MRRNLLLVLSALAYLASCKKEKIAAADCQTLHHGILNSDKEEVRSVITTIIGRMSSNDYSRDNISNLVNIINAQCGVKASLSCYDCIKTLPSETEITLSAPSTNGNVERTIDLSYNERHTMVFVNLHY